MLSERKVKKRLIVTLGDGSTIVAMKPTEAAQILCR